MKKITSLLFLTTLFLSACSDSSTIENNTVASQQQEPATNNISPENIPPATMTETKTFAMSEIEPHNSKEDCWLLIDGKVYDVTSMINKHPGGEAILLGCGKEATELFESRPGSQTPHSPKAHENLVNFYIGDLKE